MLFRDRDIAVDTVFCGLQGFAGAFLINELKNLAYKIDPLVAAIFCGGLAFTERLLRPIALSHFRGGNVMLGPIPASLPTIISHGSALFIVLKVMKVAGLIATIHPVVYTGSLLCLGSLCVITIIRSLTGPTRLGMRFGMYSI